MTLEAPTTAALPLAGFLGGIGIAIAASLLLLVNGRILGASGFLHRSARQLIFQPRQGGYLNIWNADFLALAGIVFAGTVVAVLEEIQGVPSRQTYAPRSPILRPVVAGFLVGMGSRLQNGCTSGHMICGLSRASARSVVATIIFTSFAILVANLAPGELPSITSYKWQLNRSEAVLFGTQAILLGLVLILLGVTWPSLLNGSLRVKAGVVRAITVTSSLLFGLALHLSDLTTPARVQGFLLTPLSPNPGFDPTMAFLALGGLPLSAVAYIIGHQQRIRSGHATPLPGNTETTPLNTKLASREQIEIPLLASRNDWPSVTSQIDRRLLIGAVLFGCGWGLEGICPGPALVNLGRLAYGPARKTINFDPLGLVAWILSAIIGGLLAP